MRIYPVDERPAGDRRKRLVAALRRPGPTVVPDPEPESLRPAEPQRRSFVERLAASILIAMGIALFVGGSVQVAVTTVALAVLLHGWDEVQVLGFFKARRDSRR